MNYPADGLIIDDVHVWRGDRQVLRGVGATLAPGEALHVAGPNGTGKTTLLRVVCGLLRPERGTIRWLGRDIVADPTGYQCSLAYASHETALKADLTALENLTYTVGLRRRVTRQELGSALERTGVSHCADLPARVLSAGQRRRVAMARVLASEAALWLLDEPYANLDAAGSELLSDLLQGHVSRGGLALVVAHHDLRLGVRQRRLDLDS